jgi:transcriptional regulator with XRE-family HTH domain
MSMSRTFADWLPVLKARKVELRLTHLEIDHRAGLSGGHTSKILCGMSEPSGETLARLCKALGLALVPVAIDEEKSSATDKRPLK